MNTEAVSEAQHSTHRRRQSAAGHALGAARLCASAVDRQSTITGYVEGVHEVMDSPIQILEALGEQIVTGIGWLKNAQAVVAGQRFL